MEINLKDLIQIKRESNKIKKGSNVNWARYADALLLNRLNNSINSEMRKTPAIVREAKWWNNLNRTILKIWMDYRRKGSF